MGCECGAQRRDRGGRRRSRQKKLLFVIPCPRVRIKSIHRSERFLAIPNSNTLTHHLSQSHDLFVLFGPVRHNRLTVVSACRTHTTATLWCRELASAGAAVPVIGRGVSSDAPRPCLALACPKTAIVPAHLAFTVEFRGPCVVDLLIDWRPRVISANVC